MDKFNTYDHNDLKPSKARAALHAVHRHIVSRGRTDSDSLRLQERAYGILLLEGTTIYQALKKYLSETPLCHRCDGAGFTVKPDYYPGGEDKYTDCDCGQVMGMTKLTESERAYVGMHVVLGGLINGEGFTALDAVVQDKIKAAYKAGEKWI